ncbi:MAG: hypothetical protein Q7R95_09220 [bacterium]|nr:hypothetical protein [bacterium]
MTKLYLLSRKIHRILVVIITLLTLLMAGTGLLLKYTFIAASIGITNLSLLRSLHNNLSPFFTIALILMILTGLCMYLFPVINKSQKVDLTKSVEPPVPKYN